MAASGKGGPRRGSPRGLPKAAAKGRGKDGRSAPSGSGGYGRKRLEGRGPTPKAADRTGHPAARRAAAARRQDGAGRSQHEPERRHQEPSGRAAPRPGDSEIVAGRNAVVEAMRARIPATALLVSAGLDRDPRIVEALALAGDQQVPVLESAKPELDRLTGRAQHQGVALRVPPFVYAHPDDLLPDTEPALLVALDGVTDPRNLGAVVRSTAAFGGHGVVVPARRAAGLTAAAWKASAGTAALLPVAQATNLTRALREYAKAGLLVVGLAADAALTLDQLEVATDPLVLVVGSEGGGLSRLVGEACDLKVRIPLAVGVESLNAGVAAAVALAEVARRRRFPRAG